MNDINNNAPASGEKKKKRYYRPKKKRSAPRPDVKKDESQKPVRKDKAVKPAVQEPKAVKAEEKKTAPLHQRKKKKPTSAPTYTEKKQGKYSPATGIFSDITDKIFDKNVKIEEPAEEFYAVTAPAVSAKKQNGKKSANAKKPSEKSYKYNGDGKLRVFSLGGLQEIGKNMTVIEYGDDIVVIDCGMAFPDEEMPGIDLVIPDVSYLVKNREKVRGILITHGHEDHVGAVAYVLSQINVPIYGTRLSLGIIEGKLEENPPKTAPDLRTVEAGDTVRLGSLFAEFIHVNHSIADACAIAVTTPVGVVFHTGDFKLDVSPIDGKMMDLTRIGEIGKAGVTLLLCESTNAERPGFTPSERTVGNSLERIFTQYVDRRLIIATFSSNVHRVQQIIDASHRHGRKVAILGRSMVNVIGAATELGYMDLPEDTLIDISDIKRYKPEQITLITTGSQGEPMSALYRIAFAEHDKVKLSSSDVVILSSSAIPGNEKDVGKIINMLVKNGVKVVNDATESVHVSGHACREELKLMMALLKPKYFMPIHGEYRHLYANKENAEYMGIPSQNIFVSEIGKVLEIDRKGARFNGNVPAGRVLVDGAGVGDIGAVVLRDRKHLAEDGLVVVVASVNPTDRSLVSGPDIVSRGFVYVKESEELMDGARQVAADAIEKALDANAFDWTEIRNRIKDALAKFIYQKTKRSPMILPVIMDV
ncbi:MAG: ribonuclease J [Clostridia bacterium]|nr:ribonuclease J [Clostridia bacterium]